MKSLIVKIGAKLVLMTVILFLLSFFDVTQYVTTNELALNQMDTNNYIIPAMEAWKRLTYMIGVAKATMITLFGTMIAIDVFNFIDARKEK